MSATMDVDHFSRYFNNCQAVYLEGRTYPVNVFYSIKSYDDYATACVATFFKIHKEAPAEYVVSVNFKLNEELVFCKVTCKLSSVTAFTFTLQHQLT